MRSQLAGITTAKKMAKRIVGKSTVRGWLVYAVVRGM